MVDVEHGCFEHVNVAMLFCRKGRRAAAAAAAAAAQLLH
jgi:hypothetical protein